MKGQDGAETVQKIAAAKAKINRQYSNFVVGKFLSHKADCYEYGERCGRPLVHRIRQRESERGIRAIKDGQGKAVESPPEILEAFKNYYANLYVKDIFPPPANYLMYLQSTCGGKLNDEEKSQLELLIDHEEIIAAVGSTARGKAAESNKIPLELYKVFLPLAV
ncbi:hypothetical protein NDU88_004262 [Pleurodeles waltl]|uniref:Uncharacterized protein n=1 Tax=Pleurodeles waltl TaxID=8319 RepID=A0AAV7RFM3_PLEWA|nr:hypothetical protein NDU88_004262 [Pleurodeles waltl]